MFDLDDDIQEGGRPDASRPDTPRYGRPVEIGRLVRALLRQRWVIVAGAIIGVALGVVIAKTLVPRVYSTETVLVWETTEDQAQPDVRELRTFVDSVKLPTNLATVRERLAIPQTLDRLAARLDVRFDRDSDLVVVRAEAEDPEEAVALCETTIEVFLEHQQDIARERLDEDVSSLETDVARARERLDRAQERYDDFRSEHGVSDLSLERQQAIELAASLRAQADIARADSEAAEARSEQAPRNPTTTESAQLRQARQRLETARARLSEDHPRVQALAAEVEAMQETEASTPQAQQNGAQAHAQRTRAAAHRRHEAYQRMEEEARTRLEELSSVEGEASALLASVRVAEGHVADLESDLAIAQDRARDASPGFRVVAAPLMPEEPERSYRKPAAVAIPIGAVVLVVLFVLGFELRGLRVKTANELAYWGRAPVVASTTWPGKKRELSAIVEELAEKAARAGGQTLVIAASELDQSVADDIAEHLKVTVSVTVGEMPNATYYDPDGPDLVTAPPEERPVGLLPAGEGRSDIVIDESGRMVESAGSQPPAAPRRNVPTLAKREQKTIARRRGRRLERVQVSKDQIYLDPETAPAEIVSAESGSGDAFVRRGARAADRVLVVVRSGALSVTKASELRALVGRQDDGVGFLLVGVPDWLAVLADQAGPVDRFWRSTSDA